MYSWEIFTPYKKDSNLLEALLRAKGIVGKEETELFLNPPSINYWLQNLPQEFLVALKKSKKLILEHIKQGLPIVIHGDYDVDGICASAILYKTLKKELGYKNTFVFVPNRFVHGYGLSTNSIDACLALVPKKKDVLFITVDSGITAVAEAEDIYKKGHKLIITDHHHKPDILPQAEVILWNDQIVGSALSWILSTALGLADEGMLALAAIATVTDLQPLLNLNRSLVKKGLEIINKAPPVGIKQLIELNTKGDKPISTYELGWVIGPRLNASGRLIDASASLNLLLQEDKAKALEAAMELNKVNSDRQEKTLEMYDMASTFSQENIPRVIITQDANYHEGIIGLVASKLAQTYNRPAIVISTSEEVAKGSVRSIKGINIIEILRQFGDLFVNLGGHPMAAGFSINPENIKTLSDKLTEYFAANFSDDFFDKRLQIDMALPTELINLDTVKTLARLEPYGLGNEKPLFATFKLGVSKIDYIGQQKNHLLLKLFDGNTFFKALFFNNAQRGVSLKIGDLIDIAYYLQENNFNGATYIDLILKDLRHSTMSSDTI